MSKTLNVVSEFLKGSVGEWAAFVTAALVILGVVWLICRIKAWYCEDEGPAAAEGGMLTQFRDLHRRGDLTEEEYRSIKNRLIEKSNPAPGNQQQGE